MKYRISKFVAAILILPLTIFTQSGGDFSITQSVVTGGGTQNASGGSFTISSTVGQPLAASSPASGGVFNVQSGFWAVQLAPTAAGVSISGRVMVAGGTKGIRNARLTLTNAATGETRTTLSGTFGAYRFEDVPAAQGYILTVTARRFSFAENTLFVTPLEELTAVNFFGTVHF